MKTFPFHLYLPPISLIFTLLAAMPFYDTRTRTPKISTALACQYKRRGAANWSVINQLTQFTQGNEDEREGSHLYNTNKYSQNMN